MSSSEALSAVNLARKSLMEALGDKSGAYMSHMKQWFKMKINKDEFDSEARALLASSQVHLHNEFLLAILTKVDGLAEVACDAPSSASKRAKRSGHSSSSAAHSSSSSSSAQNRNNDSSSSSSKCKFEAVDILDYIPVGSPPGSPPGASAPPRYAAQELFLPDRALVAGRFMLAAWEQGLDGADRDTVDLVVQATHLFLKNVLQAVVTQRKGYARREGGFVHDIGGGEAPDDADPREATELDEDGEPAPKRPLSADEAERETARRIARGDPHVRRPRRAISMEELYDTLKVHRNVVASHSVYAVNMERMATLLSHPSY